MQQHLTDLFVLAAEPSADLLGHKLLSHLIFLDPRLHIHAVSGPKMRTLPISTLFPMENLLVMGFLDVIAALPKLLRHFFFLRNQILALNPKVLLSIDYPGFNLRLHRSLRKKGYQGKIVHLVCPTVWAWGKKRIPLMEKNIDLLLALFPFEKACFAKSPLRVEHIGHPLSTSIPIPQNKKEQILGLFPGSRVTEIARNFSLQLNVAKRLLALDPTLKIGISIANAKVQKEIEQRPPTDFPFTLYPPDKTYELMQKARLALATSGTATLELALHETPTVVNFFIRKLDLFLAQKVFKINLPFYCIVNLIANEEVFPELFGPHLQENSLFTKTEALWFDEALRSQCLTQTRHVRTLLGLENAAACGAHHILKQFST